MIGTTEILLILVVVALLFGATKLPEFARNLGSAIGEFKKAKINAEKELKDLETAK